MRVAFYIYQVLLDISFEKFDIFSIEVQRTFSLTSAFFLFAMSCKINLDQDVEPSGANFRSTIYYDYQYVSFKQDCLYQLTSTFGDDASHYCGTLVQRVQ